MLGTAQKITETVSVGPTELGLRGNQEFLNLWAYLEFSIRVRKSGPTLGINFWVWVRVRVYNGL